MHAEYNSYIRINIKDRYHRCGLNSGSSLKDRQQEARPVLVASQCNGDYYIPLKIQYMYYIPFISLLYGLFIDIKYVPDT